MRAFLDGLEIVPLELAAYDRCCVALLERLAVRPSRPTRAVHEALPEGTTAL